MPDLSRATAAGEAARHDDLILDEFVDEELAALLRAVSERGLGPLDRVLYLTAAMKGLRQGELLGLRWRDID